MKNSASHYIIRLLLLLLQNMKNSCAERENVLLTYLLIAEKMSKIYASKIFFYVKPLEFTCKYSLQLTGFVVDQTRQTTSDINWSLTAVTSQLMLCSIWRALNETGHRVIGNQ